MEERISVTQNERVLAALAHGSVVVGVFTGLGGILVAHPTAPRSLCSGLCVFTGGLGGILVALVVWLAEREKSAYAAYQALQALVYQIVTAVVATVFWVAWLAMWMGMILLPVFANPNAYDSAPPAGLWMGLILLIVPIAVCTPLVLYGLWAALRCLGGHPFRYALIGRWMGK